MAMVAAGTLIGLTIAWVVSSVCLIALLGLYRELPAAQEGLRRTAISFAIADTALIAATALATTQWGTIAIGDLAARGAEFSADETTAALIACLLVIAAAGRSALLPLQGWLPATLAAPTPVSALLHAGVVNAGGVLLVKLSPIFGASIIATHLAFTLGAATAVYGTALMLTKADVKGALAHSTMGQMGFMIMTCGLGAYAAAVFHLVAHGLYKATLFLGSGSAVARHRRERKSPAAGELSGKQQRAVVAVALLAPALTLAAAITIVQPGLIDKPGGAALAVFAFLTAAWLLFSWLSHRPTVGAAAAGTALLAASSLAYLVAITEFGALLDLSAAPQAVSAWMIILVLCAMGLVALAMKSHSAGLSGRLYVAAQHAGYVHQRARTGRRRPTRTPGHAGPLTLQPQGNR
jgi:NADH:ubiquinone oxidoreductase subunit 5 (subunit L)/multisubunit Na+/H+ antiporter MnhA subunit